MGNRTSNTAHPFPFAFWVLTATVVLVPLAYWNGLRDYTLPPRLLILQVSLALILIVMLAPGSKSLRFPSLGLPALAYLLFNALSVLYATDKVAGLLELTKILSGFLLFLVVANQVSPVHIPRLLRAGVLTGAAISLVGIAEYLGWHSPDIPSAGLPSATLGYRNIAATYLIQIIPLGVGLFVIARTRWFTWILGFSGALMSIFLIYTRTRGAWIGLAGSALVVLALLIASRSLPDLRQAIAGHHKMIASIALAVILAFAFLPSGLEKIGPQSIDEKKTGVTTAVASIFQHRGDRGRLVMWRHTLEMVRDRPFIGVGLGNWTVHYPRYDRGDRISLGAAPERPHNDFLWILSELGLFGFLCYLWMGVTAVRATWRSLQTSDHTSRLLAVACLASLLAVAGHSMFAFPRERMVPTVFAWLVLGLLAILDPHANRQIAGGATSRLLAGLSLLLVLLQLAFTERVIRFESHMHRAAQAEKRGDWQRVTAQTDAALQAGAFHPEAVHLRGYALNRLGRFPESRNLYVPAHRRRPYDIQILNGMAIAAQNLGEFQVAHTHYRKILALIPGLTDVRYNLAGLYLKMEQPARAAGEYEAVLNAEGPSSDLCYRLATARALAGQTDDAIEIYEQALRLRPTDAQVSFALAELLYRTRRFGESLAAYRQFLQHWKGDPRYAEIARNRIAEIQAAHPQ